MPKPYKKKALKVDVNQKITDKFLEKIKSGTPLVQKTFESTDFLEFTSFHSGNAYKGINRLLLRMYKEEHQFKSNGFLTFNQATDIAGISEKDMAAVRDKKNKDVTLSSVKHPLLGQKSVGFIVFQSPIYKDKQGVTWNERDAKGRVRNPTPKEIKEKELSQIWVSRTHAVWNVDQMSHIPEKWLEKRNNAGTVINQDTLAGSPNERLRDLAQALIKKNKIKVVVGSEPDYDASKDVIVMPKLDDFVSDNSFYRSLLHQVAHWTGHKDRLDRNFDTVYGANSTVDKIAQEELVAEFASAFMCEKSGLDSFASSNLEYHASMMNPWISLLEGNNKSVLFAASRAEKISEYLTKSLDNEITLDKEVEPQLALS
jgi:antirestriction protein ArdC